MSRMRWSGQKTKRERTYWGLFIEPFPSLFLTLVVSFYYRRGPTASTIRGGFGPIPVAVIPAQGKLSNRLRDDDFSRKWDSMRNYGRCLTSSITRILMKALQNMNMTTS